MAPLRLAIMTRRFWPYCGPGEISVGEIACAVKRAGHHVEILTIAWDKNWPSTFSYREIDVTRLGQPVSGRWGAYRYLRNLSRHITDFQLDGIIVYGFQAESWAAIRGLSKQLPVVVRVDQLELNARSTTPFTSRQLVALSKVKQILVDSQSSANRLLQYNEISSDLISVVPKGVELDPESERTLTKQNAARMSLSDAHPILSIDSAQPLVVCGSPIHGDEGICDLVDCWPRILDQFPTARLWILGDGPKGRDVWENIVDRGVADSVILPGYFDDLTDVFQAADVYVHPLREDSSCGCLTRALASGLCTIATQSPTTEDLIEKNLNGLLTPKCNPEALAEAISLALNKSELRERIGRAARRLASERFDISKLVQEYVAPFMASTGCDVQTANP